MVQRISHIASGAAAWLSHTAPMEPVAGALQHTLAPVNPVESVQARRKPLPISVWLRKSNLNAQLNMLRRALPSYSSVDPGNPELIAPSQLNTPYNLPEGQEFLPPPYMQLAGWFPPELLQTASGNVRNKDIAPVNVLSQLATYKGNISPGFANFARIFLKKV